MTTAAGTLLQYFLSALPLAVAGGAVVLARTSAKRPDNRAESPETLERLALGIGWAFGLIPFIAFWLCAGRREPVTAGAVWLVAALVTGGAGAFAWRRGWRLERVARAWSVVRKGMGQGGWRAWGLPLLAALAVGALWLLKYDESVAWPESCIHKAVLEALHLTAQPADLLRTNVEDQRLGNTAVISGFVALFDGLGYRLLYSLCGVMLALGGWLLGRRFGGPRWGWAGLVGLSLNPFVLEIPILDENLLACAFLSLALPLLFARRIPWLHVGAFVGLAVMMRHVGVLLVPALVVFAMGDKRPLRAVGQTLATSLFVTFPGHLHHAAAMGSVFRFESFGQLPAVQHRIVGAWEGLLQWPFADTIVRTPWNPLPVFLMWPVSIADHMGLLLAGAALVGIVALWRRSRREAVFWLLWFLPLYGAISVQENWDVGNKMGVVYILLHPLGIWTLAGARAAIDKPLRWGAAAALAAVGVWVAAVGLGGIETAQDARYYKVRPGERPEDPAYVQQLRARFTRVAMWPDYGTVGPAQAQFNRGKLRSLGRALREPEVATSGTPHGWFADESIDPHGKPLVVEVDLSKPLFDRADRWVRIVPDTGVVDMDLTLPSAPTVAANVPLKWTPSHAFVIGTAGLSPVTGLALIVAPTPSAEHPVEHDSAQPTKLPASYHRGLRMLFGAGARGMADPQKLELRGTTIRLRVRPGPFMIAETLNNTGQNYLLWRTRLTADKPPELLGPWRPFHN